MTDDSVKDAQLQGDEKVAEEQAKVRSSSGKEGPVRKTGEPDGGDLDSVRMYLSRIGCVDLLSRDQEVEIAQRIEAARNEVLD